MSEEAGGAEEWIPVGATVAEKVMWAWRDMERALRDAIVAEVPLEMRERVLGPVREVLGQARERMERAVAPEVEREGGVSEEEGRRRVLESARRALLVRFVEAAARGAHPLLLALPHASSLDAGVRGRVVAEARARGSEGLGAELGRLDADLRRLDQALQLPSTSSSAPAAPAAGSGEGEGVDEVTKRRLLFAQEEGKAEESLNEASSSPSTNLDVSALRPHAPTPERAVASPQPVALQEEAARGDGEVVKFERGSGGEEEDEMPSKRPLRIRAATGAAIASSPGSPFVARSPPAGAIVLAGGEDGTDVSDLADMVHLLDAQHLHHPSHDQDETLHPSFLDHEDVDADADVSFQPLPPQEQAPPLSSPPQADETTFAVSSSSSSSSSPPGGVMGGVMGGSPGREQVVITRGSGMIRHWTGRVIPEVVVESDGEGRWSQRRRGTATENGVGPSRIPVRSSGGGGSSSSSPTRPLPATPPTLGRARVVGPPKSSRGAGHASRTGNGAAEVADGAGDTAQSLRSGFDAVATPERRQRRSTPSSALSTSTLSHASSTRPPTSTPPRHPRPTSTVPSGPVSSHPSIPSIPSSSAVPEALPTQNATNHTPDGVLLRRAEAPPSPSWHVSAKPTAGAGTAGAAAATGVAMLSPRRALLPRGASPGAVG